MRCSLIQICNPAVLQELWYTSMSVHFPSALLVLLSRSRSVCSVPFFPKKALMSLSSYQLSDGIRSPPNSGWPHIIFENARKLSLGSAERFSGDK